ncbi:RecF/RecN/SMC N-terminal domain protein [Candidatus Sulfopaludibacter sp. SbA4]|nr:RecF/RecN/SMC N-terminal domain protein [Candidatus Sulfopaludibacter sp. SbA4]
MLTRLYIDNFRCFVNFEYRPGSQELILGRNGSGKSSLLDALMLLRQIVVKGDALDNYVILSQRTRWLSQREITFELGADLGWGNYAYRLVVEPSEEPRWARVASETLQYQGKPIFEFANGEVRLYNEQFEPDVTYPLDSSRSALATSMLRGDNRALDRFKIWVRSLLCFRINPFAMGANADREAFYPDVDLSNFPAWYRHLVQVEPKRLAALFKDLRESIEGFDSLRLRPAGENVGLLVAEFSRSDGKSSEFYFNELSDGQRCLIGLYVILHFVLAKGGTVILDEPDNFISLREIQPWLMTVADIIEESHGQVLLISHHPEIINQWAPSNGVQFVRDEAGSIHVEKFRGDPESGLLPAELVARGWDRE